jgi:pilus assembly protein CpaB
MGRRTILLVAAIVVAAIGTTMIFVYVKGVNDRALADQSPQQVLIAKTTIAAGTTAAEAASKGAFERVDMAKKYLALGAISDPAPIANEVALAPVFPGQQILSQMFGAQGSTSALPIPGNDVAMSVQLQDPARVAGFVEPGSNVAIFLTIAPKPGSTTTTLTTRLLLPKVQIVAVGPTTTTAQTSTNTQTGATNTEQISKAILTLAVSQQEAEKIIYGQDQGTLYFALLTSNSKVATGKGTDAKNLFS